MYNKIFADNELNLPFVGPHVQGIGVLLEGFYVSWRVYSAVDKAVSKESDMAVYVLGDIIYEQEKENCDQDRSLWDSG